MMIKSRITKEDWGQIRRVTHPDDVDLTDAEEDEILEKLEDMPTQLVRAYFVEGSLSLVLRTGRKVKPKQIEHIAIGYVCYKERCEMDHDARWNRAIAVLAIAISVVALFT